VWLTLVHLSAGRTFLFLFFRNQLGGWFWPYIMLTVPSLVASVLVTIIWGTSQACLDAGLSICLVCMLIEHPRRLQELRGQFDILVICTCYEGFIWNPYLAGGWERAYDRIIFPSCEFSVICMAVCHKILWIIYELQFLNYSLGIRHAELSTQRSFVFCVVIDK